jgi:hypothetical protein
LVGVAVNVTLAPWQIGPAVDAEMLTNGVTIGDICVVMMLLEIAAALVQPSIPVRVQLTVVPFKREFDVYVLEFVPTGLPPTVQE